jgi:hypothetical protein
MQTVQTLDFHENGWVGVFEVVCSFSFYIWSCDEWASVRRPESTLPLFIRTPQRHFPHSSDASLTAFLQDPYLLTHSGTMTKCLIHDTDCGSVGVRMQMFTLGRCRGEGSRFES